MKTIDKASAPIKDISGAYGNFTPRIQKAQKELLQSKTALLADIATHQKSLRQHKANSDQINITNERLAKYQKQIKAGKPLSAAQVAQYNKQKIKLIDLTEKQAGFRKEMIKAGRSLKKSGVNTKDLAKEQKRLSDEFEKNTRKVSAMQKRYKSLNSVINKTKKITGSISFRSLTAGYTAVIATGGIALSTITSMAEGMDKLTKTAQNIKMPLDELQAMQFQAEHAGVSSDVLGASMIRLTKRLGTMQSTGGGALGGYLKTAKNPVYKQLMAAEDTQQAYETILQSFSKLKTNQEQMAFADAAFGDDGRRMLIMLRDGTKGLTKSRAEFNALGGGLTKEDAASAEAYNDALFDIKVALIAIKYKAITPVIKKLTLIFKDLITNFKNADWRDEAIQKVTDTINGLYEGFRFIFKSFTTLKNWFPEIVAGLFLLKTSFFLLNAVMMASPLGIIVGLIASFVIVMGYAYAKSEAFRKVIHKLWTGIKRVGAGLKSIGINILRIFLLIPRAILKALSVIPDNILPGGWGKQLKQSQKDIELLNKSLSDIGEKSLNYAFNGEIESAKKLIKGSIGLDLSNEFNQQNKSANDIMKSPQLQSKSEVTVHVKSDLPTIIESVKTDGMTDIIADTGGLLDFGY